MARGRPKTKFYDKDFGTPELQEKRKHLLTTEPLDLILSKKLITERQYLAAMQFRWLYTLIFGPPTLAAYDPSDLGGKYQSKYRNEKWLEGKKKIYYEAIKKLQAQRKEKLVINVCIFCEMPIFIFSILNYSKLT